MLDTAGRAPEFWKRLPIAALETPTVVFSQARLCENVALLEESLRRYGQPAEFYYSVKACTLPRVVREFQTIGWGLEVQSLAEWRTFSSPGSAGVYNSPRKTRADLVEAAGSGLVIIADSEQEVEALWDLQANGEIPPGALYGVRVQLDSCTGFYRTGQKLGMDPGTVHSLLRRALREGRRTPAWVHLHGLARCANGPEWARAVSNLLRWLADLAGSIGYRFEVLDIGGGLDSRQRIEAAGTTVAGMAAELSKALRTAYPLRLVLEPGRYTVADAAIGLCRVVRTKQVFGRRWAIVDIGTNLLIPLPLARFQVCLWEDKPGESLVEWGVGDGTCSPNGVIEEHAALPSTLAPGDLLTVLECGAYTYSLAEQFCDAVPIPVWWGEDGSLTPLDLAPPYPARNVVRETSSTRSFKQ